ncbi:MAG: type I restriction enzyme HsdR N-terminal domain-containing protein [Pseudomonadota bacterium]
MDFLDQLHQLAKKVERQQENVVSEEASKTAFVLPFLQILGYDVFNPSEVIPEFTADHGVKKGEKVDYAIKVNDEYRILIECKPCGADLEAKHTSQLYRYFSVTDARFAILTDGIRYCLYSDLDQANKMDDRSFFEFNLLDFKDDDVLQLKKFARDGFDTDAIVGLAQDLKYRKLLRAEITREFLDPSDELVKLFGSRVYAGKLTQQIKNQFTELLSQSLMDYVRERVDQRLKKALHDQPESMENRSEDTEDREDLQSDIVTTEDELHLHRILRAIVADKMDPERVSIKDGKAYCSYTIDQRTRQPVVRLYTRKKGLIIQIFDPEGEIKEQLAKVEEAYRFKYQIRKAAYQYDDSIAESEPIASSAHEVQRSEPPQQTDMQQAWPAE